MLLDTGKMWRRLDWVCSCNLAGVDGCGICRTIVCATAPRRSWTFPLIPLKNFRAHKISAVLSDVVHLQYLVIYQSAQYHCKMGALVTVEPLLYVPGMYAFPVYVLKITNWCAYPFSVVKFKPYTDLNGTFLSLFRSLSLCYDQSMLKTFCSALLTIFTNVLIFIWVFIF